ncbi:Putative zinc metalloprotease CPn_0344/CP_0416/CPj0344/CpB0350 [Chlamydiales bacterium SCGC AG-110-M15]|nr:Putative zinc metalloprotease CPn_0344/CP_0416/CPj0344/CpB0350 [Chlamydiales bacterium SCGC AG-110-M15]
MFSLLYLLLAGLGLGFLIFIHEYGHYYMALKEGMKVEVFSIGFGRPVFSWMRDGVKWQVGWIPFGGYVKITGEQADDGQDPYEMKDGFFGKSPWARIKVAAMGPIVNLVFALLAFSILWLSGGREKFYSEFSSYIGWVDPQSELYAKGVRPGDKIISYEGREYTSSKDHATSAMIGDGSALVKGEKIDLVTNQHVPFEYEIQAYPHPRAFIDGVTTLGIFDSARFLIYDDFADGTENIIRDGSPMQQSGIQPGDRIVWADGQVLHSLRQFKHVINDGRALLKIQRGDEILFARVPRLQIEDFVLSPAFREELRDWQYASRLDGKLIQQVFIPYNLSWNCVVEGPFDFIDEDDHAKAFSEHPYSDIEAPLQIGDRILAIDGVQIKKAHELFERLQEREIHMIVQRNSERSNQFEIEEANNAYINGIQWNSLKKLAASIGSDTDLDHVGKLHLLNPVKPILEMDFPRTEAESEALTIAIKRRKEEFQAIPDPVRRAEALRILEEQEKSLIVGVALQDLTIKYNPSPIWMFAHLSGEIVHVLKSLIVGDLNPKWLAGPVGIVQIIHTGWAHGIMEGLFWLALISLNLGMLNLLPLPVLDGGTICLCLFEMMSGKRLKAKTMERIILPMLVLLMGFFVFVTYHDIVRLFTQWF